MVHDEAAADNRAHEPPDGGAALKAGPTAVGGGFHRRRARRMPGEEGVWVFILGDMMVFGLFFLTFVTYRDGNVALYAESQKTLNRSFGLINTLLLLCSSWFVALAVRTARMGKGRAASALLATAFVCGIGFGAVKLLEYGEKFAAGITVLTNDFFMFYFMLTGIHFLHLLIGLGVLAWLFAICRKVEIAESDIRTIESGAAFWHLVDLLWVVLFALLYLMR